MVLVVLSETPDRTQRMSTLAAVYRETSSWRWPLFLFAYMTALAWLGSLVVSVRNDAGVPITGVVVASNGTDGAGGGGVTGVATTATPGLVTVCVTYPVFVPVTITAMVVPWSPSCTR